MKHSFIENVIDWSINNRFLVLLLTLILAVSGVYSIKQTPVDAIPDLSDVQVIVKTTYPGQAPQVVQEQVTFPLTSALMAVPGAKTVRGYSFFGDSYVYIIFDDETDMYWARSRVLEYLNQVTPNLPASAKTQLGPDATGVGWVYLYALSDKSGQHDLSELRALQDWFIKYELQGVEGVSEIATVGGMVKQYQIEVNPFKLKVYGIPLSHVTSALKRGNQEVGASVIEMAEAEYMVSTNGYITSLEDIKQIPLGVSSQGVSVTIDDIADIKLGPAMRRGVADLNGQGEVVGGVVVMRYGENAKATIDAIKSKMTQIQSGLPEGVELITVYDQSKLIDSAIENLWSKLTEELVIVVLVCALFLFHIRSALVAVVTLPLGILAAFSVMYWQGVNANIMSLGGIAIAIGAMTDGAIVMIENMHNHMSKQQVTRDNRWQIVKASATQVGPALFFSLLIITISFLPVFMLEAQEGKLFSPLAYTKTYAMAASAGLAITLIPVLMGYLIRGNIKPEHKNPINNLLIALYRPLLAKALDYPKSTVCLALLLTVMSIYPYQQLGSEFMPDLDEGDLMYMPTTYAGVSIGKAREILQQTDRLIKTVPEVDTVFGKVGRADTATDPAPMTMIETFIQLKPKSQWRPGMTLDKLKAELDSLIKFPGLSNAWVMPIKTRIDMLSTGVKTPVGLRISGANLAQIESIGKEIEKSLSTLPNTASVYAERVAAGRYIKIDIDRMKAARFNLNIADVQSIISSAIGGVTLTESIEGQARFPVNVRYPQATRHSLKALQDLPIVTENKQHITLGDVAKVYVENGAPSIKSENARIVGWVFIDTHSSDLKGYIREAQAVLDATLVLPAGYSVSWTGQFEYMARAEQKLMYVIPLTLAIIVVLLYLNFGRVTEVMMILGTLPFALIGGLWLLYLFDFNLSVAVWVGFIALAGVAVEIGVIMLVYLKQAIDSVTRQSESDIKQAVLEGASRRVRPVTMTVATIIIGLLPILFGTGVGSEVMSRIAAPMVGGMVSAVFLTLLVLPVAFYLVQKNRLGRS